MKAVVKRVFLCLILFFLFFIANFVNAQGRLGFGGDYSNAGGVFYDDEPEPSNFDRRQQGMARDEGFDRHDKGRSRRGERNDPIRKFCRDDSERYCLNMPPGPQHFQCMRKHEHDFSQKCQRCLSQHSRQRRERRRPPFPRD